MDDLHGTKNEWSECEKCREIGKALAILLKHREHMRAYYISSKPHKQHTKDTMCYQMNKVFRAFNLV